MLAEVEFRPEVRAVRYSEYPLDSEEREPDYNPSLDALGGLLIAISPNGDWENHLVVALHAYIDESTSYGENDPAACVVGYLSSAKDWYHFAKAWRAILDPRGIDIFHTNEFETEKGRLGTPYEKWSKSERDDFQNDLIAVIESTLFSDFGVVIPTSVYKKVVTPARKPHVGSPYVLCGKIAIAQAIAIAFYYGFDAPSFFIERSGKYEGRLKKAYEELCQKGKWKERLRMTSMTPIPKCKEHPELQPADYLAFNISKRASHIFDPKPLPQGTKTENYKGRPIRKLRYPLTRLYSRTRMRVRVYSENELEKVIASFES